MTDSLVYKKAYRFAIRIVNAYRYLCDEKKEFVLSKQLLWSGASIGANIAEAQGAISKADLLLKVLPKFQRLLQLSIRNYSLFTIHYSPFTIPYSVSS